MKPFTALVDRLAVTPQPTHQIALIRTYLQQTPDPDRGYALAALTGGLTLRAVRPAQLRAMMAQRADPVLLDMSLDYVGDLAETVALLWPPSQTNSPPPSLSEIVQTLSDTPKPEIEAVVASWLDACEPAARYVLLRLLTGGVRTGLPTRRIKAGIAALSDGASLADVEDVWHALSPPYAALLDWIDGRGPRPDTRGIPTFTPLMHGTAIASPTPDPAPMIAEYLWTGARVLWVQDQGRVRLFSSDGDDLSAAFPDLTAPLAQDAVLDGQLMVQRDGKPGTAEDLQRRLRRKTVNAALLREIPAAVRFFDMLEHKDQDMRDFALSERRAKLESFADEHGLLLSPLLPTDACAALHENLDAVAGAEGIILKRPDRPYRAGTHADDWLKWPRSALRFQAVLLYIQRAGGGANAALTEFTLGAVIDDSEDGSTLVPIGKVSPAGMTAEDLATIQAYARENTIERFGPVRSIRAGLVIDIACDGIESSARRKSGLRLKAPKAVQLAPDTAWQDANTLKSLLKLIR